MAQWKIKMSEPDPHDSAIETAERLQEDLERIADSELPFAQDAKQILKDLDDNE